MSLNVETFITGQQFLALETFGDEASTGSDFARCRIVDPMTQLKAEEVAFKCCGCNR